MEYTLRIIKLNLLKKDMKNRFSSKKKRQVDLVSTSHIGKGPLKSHFLRKSIKFEKKVGQAVPI